MGAQWRRQNHYPKLSPFKILSIFSDRPTIFIYNIGFFFARLTLKFAYSLFSTFDEDFGKNFHTWKKPNGKNLPSSPSAHSHSQIWCCILTFEALDKMHFLESELLSSKNNFRSIR